MDAERVAELEEQVRRILGTDGWGAGDRFVFDLAKVGEIKLEDIGDRQRLTIDQGAERIEIGENLTRSGQEWLFNELLRWKEGKRA
jgi:hypothetical protein